MKTIGAFARLLVLATALAAPAAHALVLFDVTTQLTSANLTDQGRLSRNGIAQDWSGGEAFPGIINPATTYHYATFLINVGITPFIQVEFDSVPANTFVSAYQTSFVPGNLATNWLGDAGSSGNFFGTDPLFFQVTAALNSQLVIVVNETTANGGLNQPFHLTVEGFIDTEFTDPRPATVPEPSPLLLCLVPLAVLAGWETRKRGQASRAMEALGA